MNQLNTYYVQIKLLNPIITNSVVNIYVTIYDMGSTSGSEDHLKKEHLIWRTRELLCRNRVLQIQLKTAQQDKKATLEVSKTTHESIKSITDVKLSSQTNQDQLLVEKQIQLKQLHAKLDSARCSILLRSKGMMHELWDIYPVNEFPDRKGYSICDIHLPSSEHFEGHDETMVSVAIGYVSHLLLLLSEILDITLRFPLRYYGSKSLIYCNRRNQLFPLYVESFKSREWVNFSYGMNLLNLDIIQLRTLHGLTTTDPEDTLANLHNLKLLLTSL